MCLQVWKIWNWFPTLKKPLQLAHQRRVKFESRKVSWPPNVSMFARCSEPLRNDSVLRMNLTSVLDKILISFRLINSYINQLIRARPFHHLHCVHFSCLYITVVIPFAGLITSSSFLIFPAPRIYQLLNKFFFSIRRFPSCAISSFSFVPLVVSVISP